MQPFRYEFAKCSSDNRWMFAPNSTQSPDKCPMYTSWSWAVHSHTHRNYSPEWMSSWPWILSRPRLLQCQLCKRQSQSDKKANLCTLTCELGVWARVWRGSRSRKRLPLLRCCTRRGMSFSFCCGNGYRSRLGFSYFQLSLFLGVNRRLRYDLQRMPVWNEIMSDLKEKFNNDLNHSRLNLSRPQLLSQFGGPSQVNT